MKEERERLLNALVYNDAVPILKTGEDVAVIFKNKEEMIGAIKLIDYLLAKKQKKKKKEVKDGKLEEFGIKNPMR